MSDVLFVATTSVEGGAERYISRLARLWADQGRSVGLLGQFPGWPGALPSYGIGSGPKWSLRNVPQSVLAVRRDIYGLKEVLREQQARVYSLHFKREQVLFSRTLSDGGQTVVWVEHGRFPRGLFGLVIRRSYRRAAKHVSQILCVSEIVARDIAEVIGSAEKIRTVETVVTRAGPISRAEARASLGVNQDARVACAVGRLARSKRPALAIEAARRAGYHILVAGTGPLEYKLRRRYAQDSGVQFVGHLDNPARVFAASDIHVFASSGRGEGFPTVLLEASSHGVPTVGCSGSGFEELVERTGGCSGPTDAPGLAVAIRQLGSSQAARAHALAWAETLSPEKWLDLMSAAHGLKAA